MISVAFAAHFISAVAALLYQVVWQRVLVLLTGADMHSATLVVAAFMAGPGTGSVVGGHVADRVSRRTTLGLFCLTELATATFRR